MKNKFIEIIQEPSYWVEEVNNLMYDAMVRYMESNNLNKSEFATYLGISKGRLSQILNSGEINFSIEKLFSIALKIGKIPSIKFENAEEYINRLEKNFNSRQLAFYSQKAETPTDFKIEGETKVIQFPKVKDISIAY